ncbi:hypothetical protein IFM89_004389 [Coptis chinensis]|uniref:Cytochrome P450 n=1 Tax=Coptis chinensis TaxID=261450 RepID=A0A835I1I9_9MAGN|nr:hypothetical protein IFM89_004389 [Coptis chinensis]
MSDIVKNPVILALSLEKRIIPRCNVLEILYSNGLIGRVNAGSVTTALKLNEVKFIEKYVTKYQVTVPEMEGGSLPILKAKALPLNSEQEDRCALVHFALKWCTGIVRQSLLVTLTFAILNNMPGVIAAPYVLLGMCQTAHSNRVPGATVHLERKFSIAIFLLFILPLYFFIFIKNKRICPKSSTGCVSKLPRSYPLIGSSLAIIANKGRYSQWFAEILSQCPTRTFVFHRALGKRQIVTANPSNVQHILKTKFSLYPKGDFFATTLVDFLGNGIFNADGDNWKFGRQILSHEFNTKSLRKFVETVVDSELSNRLIPFSQTRQPIIQYLIFKIFSNDLPSTTFARLPLGLIPSTCLHHSHKHRLQLLLRML